MEDLSSRISVLEAKVSMLEKSVEKADQTMRDNYEVTTSIKERLDKQNGWLPHLIEDVQELKSMIKVHTEHQVESAIKVKIVWSIFGAIGASLIGIGIKLMLTK